MLFLDDRPYNRERKRGGPRPGAGRPRGDKLDQVVRRLTAALAVTEQAPYANPLLDRLRALCDEANAIKLSRTRVRSKATP